MNKIIRKIAKCLRLAGSSNPAEASTAMRQAQKLMKKHNISQDEVSMSDVSESSTSTGSRSRLNITISSLASMIDYAFGTEHYGLINRSKPSEVVFVGVGSSPEIAKYVFAVLLRQLKVARKQHYKSIRGKRINKIRKADLFAMAWIEQVKSKVIKFAGNEETNELINKYMQVSHSDLVTRTLETKAKKGDGLHILKGKVAGQGVTLNHAMSGEHQPHKLT